MQNIRDERFIDIAVRRANIIASRHLIGKQWAAPGTPVAPFAGAAPLFLIDCQILYTFSVFSDGLQGICMLNRSHATLDLGLTFCYPSVLIDHQVIASHATGMGMWGLSRCFIRENQAGYTWEGPL